MFASIVTFVYKKPNTKLDHCITHQLMLHFKFSFFPLYITTLVELSCKLDTSELYCLFFLLCAVTNYVSIFTLPTNKQNQNQNQNQTKTKTKHVKNTKSSNLPPRSPHTQTKKERKIGNWKILSSLS